jgi:hypothetical protein
MIPRCQYHVGAPMREVKSTTQQFYGKHRQSPNKHYHCPVAGCRFVATVESPQPKRKPKHAARLVLIGLIR